MVQIKKIMYGTSRIPGAHQDIAADFRTFQSTWLWRIRGYESMSITDSIIRRFSSDGVSLTRHEFKCAYTATLGVKPTKVAYIVHSFLSAVQLSTVPILPPL